MDRYETNLIDMKFPWALNFLSVLGRPIQQFSVSLRKKGNPSETNSILIGHNFEIMTAVHTLRVVLPQKVRIIELQLELN